MRTSVTGSGLDDVSRADFVVGRRRLARDRRAPFAATLSSRRVRRTRSRRLRVVLSLRDGRQLILARTLRAC